MGLKRTHLLSDDPATEDEIGPHKRVAEVVRDEILGSQEGRSIALVGEWGSGKSTVINLLEEELRRDGGENIHVFIYDAWSHEGDPLRRSFLDDLISSLKKSPRKSKPLLTEAEIARETEEIWNRAEVTTTTSEPVLRRHAKWLLLTLFLVPFGMEFFEIPSDPKLDLWSELCSARNWIAYGLWLVPVVSIVIFALIKCWGSASLKNFVFGEGHKDKNFSVLSFFFQKVQGEVEKKLIKSPADSIGEFRRVFSSIVESVHSNHPKLRLVIIIDNIDRVPPDRARSFWSTMQTFFGETGGLRMPQTMKYWLIAPFSLDAMPPIFHDTASVVDDAPVSNAKGYIDKTFSLTFFVPPPILVYWRKYLLGQLEGAFPEHDQNDRFAVREIFDLVRSSDPATITPRAMKLFVNALVALYRQRGDEISLPVMATYLLHKSAIGGMEIPEELLSPMEQRVIDEPNWRALIASLHFGVSPEEGAQLLLEKPIRTALRKGSSEKLKKEENRPGFLDVLRRIILSELESPQKDYGAKLAQIAVNIGALESAGEAALHGIWKDFRGHLREVAGWGGFQSSPAQGIKAILDYTPESEKLGICRAASKSLSQADVPDPEGNYQAPNASAAHCLSSAVVILDAVKEPQSLGMTIPGSNQFQLEFLQQLADLDAQPTVKTAIKPTATAGNLTNAIVGQINNGNFLRSPAAFVAFIAEILKIALNWAGITKASLARLSTPDVKANECHSLITLVLSSSTIAQDPNAIGALKELSTQGHLSHLLYLHREDPGARSAILTTTLLANPTFERPAQVATSPNGDAEFNKVLGESSFDPELVDGIAEFVISVRAGDLLFQVGAKNENIARLTASIVGSIARTPYEFDIDPQFIVEHKAFLETHMDISAVKDFTEHLKRGSELLGLLSSQPFEVDRCHLYLSTLDVAAKAGKDDYLVFLNQGILALDQANWEQALNAISGPYFYLVELCSGLQKLGHNVDLSTSARDAILAQVRKVGSGEIAVSDEVRARLAAILGLVQESQQKSLTRDFVDDMMGSADSALVSRIVELVGDHIDLKPVTDADRIVRRIFVPILSGASERTADWMVNIIEQRVRLFEKLPAASKNEFGLRLQAALQSEVPLSKAVLASLTRIADLLSLKVDAHDQNADQPGDQDSEG